MGRRAFAQVVADLAAVDFGDVALHIEYRHDQRAVEVFVAAVAVETDFLQAGADFRAGNAIFLRQAQA